MVKHIKTVIYDALSYDEVFQDCLTGCNDMIKHSMTVFLDGVIKRCSYSRYFAWKV